MKRIIKIIAAALAAVTAMTCTSVTAFADKLRNIDGVRYLYSDSGEELGVYTGWANTSNGKVFYNNGVRITTNAVINGIRYKFSSDGYCTGKYTGWTRSLRGRRYWSSGVLVRNKWLRSGSYYYYAGIDGYMIVEKSTEKYPALKALSASREKELCQQYAEWTGLQDKITAEDLFVPLYLGNYNGNDVAVIMTKEGLSEIDFSDLGTIECGDIEVTVPVCFEPVVSINNEIEFLDVAYLENYLNDSDIKKINYYMNKFIAGKGVDPTAQQKKYPALTALTDIEKETLFSDFIKYKGDAGEWKGVSPEDLYIVKYYGKYNGCEAVVIWGNEQICTDDIKDINIAGYTVSLGSGSFELLLHRNGTFISVESAYKKGYLSKSDIEMISYYANY